MRKVKVVINAPKCYRVISWPTVYPSIKFHENRPSGFCVILLIQTEDISSTAAVITVKYLIVNSCSIVNKVPEISSQTDEIGIHRNQQARWVMLCCKAIQILMLHFSLNRLSLFTNLWSGSCKPSG